MKNQHQKLDGRQKVMLGFAKTAEERDQHFFYILIREPLDPIARSEKYEDPLTEALGDEGEVTGGGSQLGEGNTIEYCGLDVVVENRERGLELIRRCLRRCGAPENTVIEEYIPTFKELKL